MRFLGTKEDGIISAYYTIKYMGKDPVKVKHMLPVFYVARKDSRQSKAKDKGPERDAMTFINRSMNNYTGCCEFGETQVAANLLGHESYHASHTFWNFIVNGFIDHQHKLHKQPDAEDETDSSSDDASVISDWEDAEDDTIDALSKRGLDDEGQGMVSK